VSARSQRCSRWRRSNNWITRRWPGSPYIAFTYATNNAATVTYREGGATGTMTYLQRSGHRRLYNALTAPSAPSTAAPLAREVSTYADLPLDASAPVGSAWRVLAGSGIPLYSRHAAGVYVRSSAGNVTRDSDYTFAGKAVQIVVVKEAA
jgi:hypothetical protein